MADLSRTENTADVPLGGDTDGRLLGIAGSWEVFDSLYAQGMWSRETKYFRSEVARTPVDIHSEQPVTALGGGITGTLANRPASTPRR